MTTTSDRARMELLALSERWRSRARSFMADAEVATNSRDVIRLAAMAVTLEVAARDLDPLVAASFDVSGEAPREPGET